MSEQTEQTEQTSPSPISTEFIKIITDLVRDIKTTFPEYVPIIDKWWKMETDKDGTMRMLYAHCTHIIPERMMDILYQNEDIYSKDSELNTEFLPGISFKYLWQCDITDKTRETLWKYLQMLMISIIGNIQDKNAFGEDTAKIFDSIDEEDFKKKLQDALGNIKTIFETNDTNTSEDNDDTTTSESNMPDLPSVDNLHEHINGMLGGKLGQLAQEIAEETTSSLDLDLENMTDPTDIFKTLMSNPTKLMSIVKDVGSKLESKMSSGEINQAELMTEATEMMNNMKNIPGLGNIQQMMSQMGIPNPMNNGAGNAGNAGNAGAQQPSANDMEEMMKNMPDMEKMMQTMGLGGRNTRMNKGAMQSKMKQEIKKQQMKERLRQQVVDNTAKQNEKLNTDTPTTPNVPSYTDDELISIFSTGETYEKTPRKQNASVGKKKKGKKDKK